MNLSRDTKGNIGFAVLALVLGIIVLPFMAGREVYLYFRYLKPCELEFEWLDLVRYSIIIGIFSLFHWCIIDLCSLPLILAL